MKWLILFLMLAAGPGFGLAQTPAQKKAPAAGAAPRWPIESLQVEGNHSYTPEQVLAVAGLKVGQVVGRAALPLQAVRTVEAALGGD